MSQMTIELSPEIEKQLNLWSITENEPPETFIEDTLQKALEDWEDYMDALRISAEVKAGRMETYSEEEVWRNLDVLDD